MKIREMQMPEGIAPKAEKQVREIIERFEKDNRLDRLDAIAMMMLAGNLQTYLDSLSHLREEGLVHKNEKNGRQTLNQWFIINKYSQTFILELLKQFGLTPASRSKLKLPEGEEEDFFTKLNNALN